MTTTQSIYNGLTKNTAKVLDSLIYFCQWKTFRCWASQETIAKFTFCCKRTVERALVKLVEIGYGTYSGGGGGKNKVFVFSKSIQSDIHRIKNAKHGKYASRYKEKKQAPKQKKQTQETTIPDCLKDIPLSKEEKLSLTSQCSPEAIEHGSRVFLSRHGNNPSVIRNIAGFIRRAGEGLWKLFTPSSVDQNVESDSRENVESDSIYINTSTKKENSRSNAKSLGLHAAASLFENIPLSQADKDQLLSQCSKSALEHGIRVYSALPEEKRRSIFSISGFIHRAGEFLWPIPKNPSAIRERVLSTLGHLNGSRFTSPQGITTEFSIFNTYVEFSTGVHSHVISYDDPNFTTKLNSHLSRSAGSRSV